MILSDLKDLAKLRSDNPKSKIVMLNGAFDLFHVGHLEFIDKAKSMGDLLVVTLTSDDSIGQGKGSGRPIIGQSERAKILDSVSLVDYVFLNNEDSSNVFEDWPGYHLRPNFIVSGDKRWYQSDPRVKALGIETIVVERGNVSTTDIIKRIQSAED